MSSRPNARTTKLRGSKRVGELDEEMVYESRVGDVFTLGSSTWRIEEITPDRVLVSPAPGIPGRLPFWKGDSLGRPVELGQAIGKWLRTTLHNREDDTIWQGMDAFAQENLRQYIDEQLEATGVLPSDNTVVIERFRDELGDWRIVIHSPLGARVHAPWALVISDRVRQKYGIDASVSHSDDGIVLRLPQVEASFDFDDPFAQDNDVPATAQVVLEDLFIDPAEVTTLVRDQVSDSSLFGARFREAAARALLLPKARPDKRQPLWQQRQRAAQLLSVASSFPDFPIVLEAVRECLQDDFDVPALKELMAGVSSGSIRIVEVETPHPSPFASSLLFGYTAQFIYDEDAPLAERRAAALTLDPTLLAELLGADGSGDLADLLDPAAVEQTIREVGYLTEQRSLKTAEHVWEYLLRSGPNTLHEIARRMHGAYVRDHAAVEGSSDTSGSANEEAHFSPSDVVGDELLSTTQNMLEALENSRRVIRVRLVNNQDADPWKWAAIEDAGRLRDALGVALPVGIPEAFTELVPDPLGDLVRRHARTHGPFTAAQVANRMGLGVAVVQETLRRLVSSGHLVAGRLSPTSTSSNAEEYCDADVMRTLRRRSLAALRAEVEPVAPHTLGVFLAQWQKVSQLRGVDGLYQAIEQLTGAPIPVSALESQVLPARVTNYSPSMLDELLSSGEVLWFGHRQLPGPRGGKDASVSLHLNDGSDLTLPSVVALKDHDEFGDSQSHQAVYQILSSGGAYFIPQIATEVELPLSQVSNILWDLVWAGLVSNDSFVPMRSLLGNTGSAPASRTPTRARSARSRFGGLSRPLVSDASTSGIHSGRWSALPLRNLDPTSRLHAAASVLMDRYGVVTRNVNLVEELEEPFGQIYRVLSTAESMGKVRRGYFIETLGGSQFAHEGAVDLLRTTEANIKSANERAFYTAQVLAACDPANPYGGLLAWPHSAVDMATHRPGRKAGATVVLVNGELCLYVEKGGKSLLTFSQDLPRLTSAAQSLAQGIDSGRVPKVHFSKIDGANALSFVRATSGNEAFLALKAAGYTVTPSGVRYLPTQRQSRGYQRA